MVLVDGRSIHCYLLLRRLRLLIPLIVLMWRGRSYIKDRCTVLRKIVRLGRGAMSLLLLLLTTRILIGMMSKGLWRMMLICSVQKLSKIS